MNDNNDSDNLSKSPDQPASPPPANDFQFTSTPETGDNPVAPPDDSSPEVNDDLDLVDPLSELDAEPSTQPLEPGSSPFSDATFDPEPHQQPKSTASDQTVTVKVDSSGTKPDKRSKSDKPAKSPKAKKSKAPKTPKSSGGKQRRSSTVIISVLVTLILLAGIAAALWFFVFQPTKSDTTDNNDVDTAANVAPEPTAATSAELMIDQIQTALHDELDELYEDMTIDTSSPDSAVPVTGPAYQVDDADYSVRTNTTYSLSVARSDNGEVITTDSNFTKSVVDTTTDSLTEAGYTKGKSSTDQEAIYQTDAVICSLTDSVPTIVTCADKSAYQATSDTVAPFAAAYLASGESTKPVEFGTPQISDSKTEGYQLAEVPTLDAMSMFYRKGDQAWQFFTSTQSMLTCDAYDSDTLKAAYAGEQCLQPDSESTRPITVDQYVADSKDK